MDIAHRRLEIKSLARDISSDNAVPVMGVLNRIGEIRAEETAGLHNDADHLPVVDDSSENVGNNLAMIAMPDAGFSSRRLFYRKGNLVMEGR